MELGCSFCQALVGWYTVGHGVHLLSTASVAVRMRELNERTPNSGPRREVSGWTQGARCRIFSPALA